MVTITHTNGSITVEGHAGYAPPGQDIVCSAISTLLQNLILSVEKLTADNLKTEIRTGFAKIEYENLSECAQLLLDSFFIGVKAVSISYPNYVRIID